MKTYLLIALAGLGLATTSAHARDDWKHKGIQSAEGVAIRLDYQVSRHVPGSDCDRCPSVSRISQAWLNVTSPSLRKGDRVRVVFINYAKSLGSLQENRDQRVIDLTYAEDGRFTGELGGFPIAFESVDAIYLYRQELAIVINGQWLKDPVSGLSNFGLTLQ